MSKFHVYFQVQSDSGETDCAIEFRRQKLARNDIWHDGVWRRTKSDPGHANRGEAGSATAISCKQPQNEILKVPARSSRGDEQL